MTLNVKYPNISRRKKIGIIISIFVVPILIGLSFHYYYVNNNVIIKVDEFKCPTIKNFGEYVNYMRGPSWSSYCLPPSYAIKDSIPVSVNQTIQHVITAKVIQFKDIPQRTIITANNEKYLVDNYTKSMKIGDIIHIFEVKNTVTKCLPLTVNLYNGSEISGISNVSKFLNGTHWLDFTSTLPDLFFAQYNDDSCKPFMSYFEVNVN